MVNPPCFLKEVPKSHVGMIIPNRLRKAENVKSKKQSKAPPRIGGELCDSLMIPNSSPNQGTHRNMKASSAFKSLFALTRIVDVEPVFCAISIKKPVFHSPCKRGCFEDFWQKKITHQHQPFTRGLPTLCAQSTEMNRTKTAECHSRIFHRIS